MLAPAYVVPLQFPGLTDEMKSRTKAEGLDAAGGPPEELGEIIRRDVEKWRRVVREAKIKSEG